MKLGFDLEYKETGICVFDGESNMGIDQRIIANLV